MEKIEDRRQNLWLGLLFMFLAGLALAEVGAVGKVVQQRVSPLVVVFVQNLVSLLCVIPIVLIRRGWRGFATQHIGLHLIRDFAGSIGFLLFFISLSYISLTDGILLNNTGPLFVPFIVWVWLHHRFPTRMYWGVILGFIGVVFILQPKHDGFQWAMLLALLSGITMAITFVAIRLLNRTEGPFVILFYYFLVGSLLTLPLAIWKWQAIAPLDWLLMILVGAGILLLQVSMVLAFQWGAASVLAPLIYLSLIWSTLIDWLVWNQVPNWLSTIGIVLVVIGGVVSLVLSGSKTPPPTRIR